MKMQERVPFAMLSSHKIFHTAAHITWYKGMYVYMQRDRQSLDNYQPDAVLLVFIYFKSIHVSSITVPIIRRSNCISTSSGMIILCK